MTIKKSMANSTHYRILAAKQAEDAAATKLPNVRQRCLEAERWLLEMAERAEAVEIHKQEQAAAIQPRPARPRRFR